jgi:hypothetical protein
MVSGTSVSPARRNNRVLSEHDLLNLSLSGYDPLRLCWSMTGCITPNLLDRIG